MRREREAEAARRKKRQRVLTILAGVVIVGLLAAIAFVIARAAGGDDSPGADGEVVAPQGATADGGVVVGAASAPVEVAIYYDYMCPACGAFEQANGEELNRLLEDEVARIELRPISFLDETSQGTRYSTRAANAFATVADQAPDQAWAFHEALYAEQPQEGTEGLSDDAIATIAEDAGVPAEVIEEFTDLRHEGWVAEVTEKAFDSGVEGTPTVLIDGEPFDGDLYQPGPLTAAIEAAAGE
jgi:protein-disulfide isomerase